jgi:isoquinoline 1-oxidoreductase alpha subunit
MADYQLQINGEHRDAVADPSTPLLWVLREDLKMTGTKYGCGIGACGACTVHVAGQVTRSCVLPVSAIENSPVVTIEGIGQDPVGRMVQDSWVEMDVVQCGYCQSGQIMSAVALLKANADPTDADIELAMSNLCRCGTYVRIRAAIQRASQHLKTR